MNFSDLSYRIIELTWALVEECTSEYIIGFTIDIKTFLAVTL